MCVHVYNKYVYVGVHKYMPACLCISVCILYKDICIYFCIYSYSCSVLILVKNKIEGKKIYINILIGRIIFYRVQFYILYKYIQDNVQKIKYFEIMYSMSVCVNENMFVYMFRVCYKEYLII